MKVTLVLDAADDNQNRDHASEVITALLMYLGVNKVKAFLDEEGLYVVGDVTHFTDWTNRLPFDVGGNESAA